MQPDELAQYKPLFLQTAWDYLRQLETSIDFLRENTHQKEAIVSAHISAHSLKSQSIVMNYEETAKLCHELEQLFSLLKDTEERLSSDDLVKLTGVVMSLKEAVSAISADHTEPDMTAERHIVAELRQQKGVAA